MGVLLPRTDAFNHPERSSKERVASGNIVGRPVEPFNFDDGGPAMSSTNVPDQSSETSPTLPGIRRERTPCGLLVAHKNTLVHAT